MLTYIDCCDDIFYPRAVSNHLQTQPKAVKAIKSLLRQLPAQTWLHQMLALPIYVQKSRLHPQFGNISGLKLMKTTTPSRCASFASKRFLLLEKYFQPSTASLQSSSWEGTRARETRLIKLQLSNLSAKDSCNLCNC